MTVHHPPNIAREAMEIPSRAKLALPAGVDHPPRIQILYGSLRPPAFLRKLALKAQRILQCLGAKTRVRIVQAHFSE